MGEPENLNSSPSASFPPGCLFFPTDKQILQYYLARKNSGDLQFGVDMIKEINLYDFNPFVLPGITCFRFGRGGRRRHWYCYTARVLNERKNRKCKGGYWKRSGRVRLILSEGAHKFVVGARNRFVFYLGTSLKRAIKTDWIMYEYALIHSHEASFVVCRVFVRSAQQQNNIEIRSATNVRHIGIQHHGTSTRGETDVNSPDRKHVDPENNVEPGEQIRAPHMDGKDFTYEQINAVLNGDYIELDDLALPLPGVD